MTATSGPSTERDRASFLAALLHDDPVELYDAAPCGFLTTTPDGVVVKANTTFRRFIGLESDELVGQVTFAGLLSVGGRIYYETHLAPSLLMRGEVHEVALELLRRDGTRVPVLINASVARTEDGGPRAIRIAVFDATERRRYEQQLLEAKQRAEASELVAVTLARTLQQTLIPPALPVIPDLELAAVFHPAGHGTDVGGDFYDVFTAGAGEYVVTLGDVCGKGYEAAIVTSLVRHTIRALSVGETSPASVLAGLDEVLLRHETERYCTAAVLRLHHEAGRWRLTAALGGHPTPVLVCPGRPARPIGGRGPIIGILDGARFADEELLLEPGDSVLLYTDGVPEARRDRELFGDDRLLAAVERAGPVPAELVAAVLEEVLDFQAGDARDDVAMVALRVPPLPPGTA